MKSKKLSYVISTKINICHVYNEHVLTNFLHQDILVKYKKLLGFKTLWIPIINYDVAFIEKIFCNKLKKDGINKSDLGEQNFNLMIKDFIKSKINTIKNKLNKLECSINWIYQYDNKLDKLRKYKNIKILDEENIIQNLDDHNADIMRFTLIYFNNSNNGNNSNNINFGKTFFEKLQNHFNSIMTSDNLSKQYNSSKQYNLLKLNNLSHSEKIIINKLNVLIDNVNNCFKLNEYTKALKNIYDFTINDYFTNITNIDNNTSVYVFIQILSLLYPFMPIITNDYLSKLLNCSNSYLKYPKIIDIEINIDIIKSIRNIKKKFKVAKNDLIDIIIVSKNDNIIEQIKYHEKMICKRGGIKKITYDVNDTHINKNKYIKNVINDNLIIYYHINEKFRIDLLINRLNKINNIHNNNVNKELEYYQNLLIYNTNP